MDDQRRQNILDDLRGFIKGELLFDDISRALYSTDASIFQVRPAGVVAPADEEDVCNLVRYAAENGVPLIPRGAGSGMAGESLGKGLVLDLSRNFRRILDTSESSVRVQVGVTCREVNAHLAAIGRRFAPDPASGHQCTVGGMLATDASGARALRHGYTRDHVAKLRAVLDTGEAVEVGLEPVQPSSPKQGEHLQDIIAALALLLEDNAALIRSCRPRTPFDRCGYQLQGVFQGDALDLPRLLVGSEGTLAVFTEAVLRTVPLPGGRSVVLLGFESIDHALQAAQEVLTTGPSACELVDRRLLSLARGRAVPVIPASAEAVLLVEYEADSAEEAQAAARRLPQMLSRRSSHFTHVATAIAPEEVERLWALRESALPNLYGLRNGAQPVALIEDVGVPPQELPRYLRGVQEILQEHETTASFLIHVGTGQVHARPFLDLRDAAAVGRMYRIAEDVHALALELGGTVSSQHGTGLARTPWVARQYGALYPVFRQVKMIFDPQNIFNPGKIIDPDPELSGLPLREAPLAATELAPALRWTAEEMKAESLKCNGCGECRTDAPTQRMCPIFHATRAEAATPRAKANLLRHLFAGPGERPSLSAAEVREVADLCVNCRMCARECPARVNVPKLMLEAKAANVAQHGLDRKDWFFARTESFCRWASRFALPVNFGLASRVFRWVLEKTFGISAQRRLPRFALRTFLSHARRRGWTRRQRSPREQVAYFVDLYANYNDPLIGLATALVLQHNGIDVYVPPGQRGCGMEALAYGDVETARETAQRNLRVLADVARDGMTIVCSEPTAALMLSQDYPDLIDEPDARLVASQTVELTSYLWQLHEQGRLRTDFQSVSINVGHHVPCHLKALGRPPAGPQLLALIPGMQVHTIDVSCSGMAGTFGMNARNYPVSLEAGRPMLLEVKRPEVTFGSTECSACRMQMEDGGGKRTLHPVQYLALAYGLLPKINRRLQEPIGRRTLR